MNTQDKIDKLKEFKNEDAFRKFLIDFLTKSNFKDVFHTHRYGAPEQGKDIIGRIEHPITGNDWFAFVVKKGRISGGTNEIETIKNQISQSFEYPYQGLAGEEIKINKVIVVTNENFTGGAQSQIATSPKLRTYNNFSFWWNENLIPLIDKNYNDFWLPGDSFAKEFSRNFTKELEQEISIKELSLQKVDDKKIQKLIDIFVEPKITVEEIEEDKKTKEKRIHTKKFRIDTLNKIEENYLLSGEQGSGKTKILNKIACQLALPENISKSHQIPIRLKALNLRDVNFDIQNRVDFNLEKYGDIFFDKEVINNYQVILLIDDFDLLKSSERDILKQKLEEYCDENQTHFIITYSKNELGINDSVKTVKIHNFNTKQIESFITKFFEGTTGRSEKFIQILKESNILSKLPTTPLTISLISLLYDQNNFEIPATLSDIYSDFTNVLLGKVEVYNKTELLTFNLKRRIFTSLALKMMDERIYEISLADFTSFVNSFLSERSYQTQSNEEILDIIEKSNLLYKTEEDVIGFKKQAFIEFLAAVEVYHHKRGSHYSKLIENFNDIPWQNTAIFYAGQSKELDDMIDDVITKAPNNNLRDWFINSSGMGYLAQALYQTKPSERQKLVFKALDNLILAYREIKPLTQDSNSMFFEMPMPLLLGTLNHWYNENFKSITLTETLKQSFDKLYSDNLNFEETFKLLMISSTLMTPYINSDEKFEKLLEKEEFINHPILPLVADFVIELGLINKKDVKPDIKDRIVSQLKKKRQYLKEVIKEPAYRFNESFAIEK